MSFLKIIKRCSHVCDKNVEQGLKTCKIVSQSKGNSKTVPHFPELIFLCGFWRVFCNIIPMIIQTVTAQEPTHQPWSFHTYSLSDPHADKLSQLTITFSPLYTIATPASIQAIGMVTVVALL